MTIFRHCTFFHLHIFELKSLILLFTSIQPSKAGDEMTSDVKDGSGDAASQQQKSQQHRRKRDRYESLATKDLIFNNNHLEKKTKRTASAKILEKPSREMIVIRPKTSVVMVPPSLLTPSVCIVQSAGMQPRKDSS